jgi:hypothetical protein
MLSEPAGEPPVDSRVALSGEATVAVLGKDMARSRLSGSGVTSVDCPPGSDAGVLVASGGKGTGDGGTLRTAFWDALLMEADTACGGDSSSGSTYSSRMRSESSGSGCAPAAWVTSSVTSVGDAAAPAAHSGEPSASVLCPWVWVRAKVRAKDHQGKG